jgi:hypothetical protein
MGRTDEQRRALILDKSRGAGVGFRNALAMVPKPTARPAGAACRRETLEVRDPDMCVISVNCRP